MESSFAKQWYQRVHDSLMAQAQTAGLLGHATSIGNAREFVSKVVLRSFLPPIVHIGSGVVIDSNGKQSKQVDIVLFDPRFPLFEVQNGLGTYPVEGVIATIEVKSNLNRTTLREALENCRSINELKINYEIDRDVERFTKNVDRLMDRRGVSRDEAVEILKLWASPATYVLSFDSVSNQTIMGHINEWLNEHEVPPPLPRMILTPKGFGVINDRVAELESKTENKVLMAFSNEERLFGALASHIVLHTTKRIGLTHGNGVRYYIDNHFLSQFETEMQIEQWPDDPKPSAENLDASS